MLYPLMPIPIITCHAAIRGEKNSFISINHTEKFITLTVKKINVNLYLSYYVQLKQMNHKRNLAH